MSLRRGVLFFLFAVIFLFGAGSSYGQTSQGRITGQVTDASGGTVAGATVTIENLGTQIRRVLQTNSAGDYVAPALDAGFYSITVEAQGFAKVVRERVQIEVTNDLKIDFQLKPGSRNEVIEVKDEAPLTETSNAVLNGVLSNKAINELPVQGRDFQNLLTLHPGVQRTPGGGFHSTTSNGNRPDDNNYIIDGATDNDAYYGETVVGEAGVQGTPASLLPLDAITEFTTQEGPQADYGTKPGVVMTIGLKSGTDEVHGTAYYFHRNAAFDARNYFNPILPDFPEQSQASALLLHQFGVSIGGPIKKGKLFYFGNYEGIRDKVGNPFAAFSPVTAPLGSPNCQFDPNGTGADDSRTCLAAARAATIADFGPGAINPLADNLVNKGIFLPNPGGTFDPNNPVLIDFDFPNVNRADNAVMKFDYHPNDTNTISGRFFYANTNQTEEDGVPLRPEWLSRAIVRTQVFGVDWVWTPSSRLQNQAIASYNQFWEKIAPLDSNVSPMTAWGLDTGITDPNLQGFPTISPGQEFNHLGGTTGWPLWTTPSRTQNYADTVTYTIGKHTLRFGGNVSHGDVNYLRGNNGRGVINFRHLENFFDGDPRNGRLLVGDLKRNVSQNAFALFLNDDFRVTRRVTLNLGVRYDITRPIKEANNLIANFDPNVGIVQVGHGISEPYPTHYNNLSPRLGVAWDVFGTGKTVVRAGGGIIFEQPVIRTFINSTGLNLNPAGVPGAPGTGTINTFQRFLGSSQINFTGNGTIFDTGGNNSCDPDPDDEAGCDVFGTAPNLKTPYVANWNLNIQQALGASTMLQIAYVGNRGIKLYSNTDINQANPLASANCILQADANQDPAPTFPGPIDAFSNIDYVPCEQANRPFFSKFPSLQYITILGNQSSSIYHALQVTLTKRYAHGLYLLAGYTFAHAIDTATNNLASTPQNSQGYAADRGNGDFDIRHRFTFSATYDIPGHEAPLQMLKGWQLTTIVTLEGGEPFALNDFVDDVSATGEFSDRWNITGPVSGVHWTKASNANDCNTNVQLCFFEFSQDQNTGHVDPTSGDPRCISAAGNQAAQDQLVNLGCYIEGKTILTPPALGTFGNLGRNTFRGPSLRNWDFSVSKVWNLNEKLKLQLRGEFFNILNHPNFDVFTMNTDMSTGPGLAQVVATPDVGNANPVVGSGGSRHIQLGLKLTW